MVDKMRRDRTQITQSSLVISGVEKMTDSKKAQSIICWGAFFLIVYSDLDAHCAN